MIFSRLPSSKVEQSDMLRLLATFSVHSTRLEKTAEMPHLTAQSPILQKNQTILSSK